jgi:prophage maintenance system killer protein
MTKQHGVSQGEIVLYQDPDGTVELDVRLERESIWLSLNQMAELFDRDKSVISRHLHKVFKEGELEQEATVAKNATVQREGGREVVREIEYFNLDAVLSVGYRVNSKRGTQFRIWATRVLRDHLVQGYTVNERRLRDLNQAVRLIAGMADRRDLSGDEATALLRVVGEYRFALDLLDDYDYQRVGVPPAGEKAVNPLSYTEALRIVEQLRERFGSSSLFGRQKDEGLQSALGAVMQTFGGRDLYPSLEEKAAHLLYFLIKNHAFVDGNKRIGAALFLWFLEKNGALRDRKGERRVSDAALVAVTLLIAESKPVEKEIIVRIVTHLLCEREGG